MISPFYTKLDIPYEVVILLVKNNIWEKINNGTEEAIFKTIIIGKEKATKNKLEKAIEFVKKVNSTDKYSLESGDIKTVTIKNKDFNLSLAPNTDRIYCLNYYGYQINFSNKNLKINYKICTYINDYNLIDIVESCSFVTNNKIHGNFFYKDESGFYQYRPEDRNLIENLDRVNCLGSNKKTTNFKIGHKYILKGSMEKIIYLGTINKDVRYRTSYNWDNESNHSYFVSCLDSSYKYINGTNYHLYLNLDIIYNTYGYDNASNSMSSIEEYIEMSKGKSVCKFLVDLIEYFETNSTNNLYNCISYSTSLKGGVDVGEYFLDDNSDIKDTIDSLCFEKINSKITELKTKKDVSLITPYIFSITSDYVTKFDEDTKELLFKILVSPVLENMFRKNRYRYGQETLDKIKAENTNVINLYNLLKTCGSYYVNELESLVIKKNSIGNLIFKGSEDKLINLIIGCKKAYFK